MTELLRVCKFCGALATERTPYPLDLTTVEHDEWMDTGKRVDSLSDDGMGERDLAPGMSPVEAAYRRGVCQALYWAKNRGSRSNLRRAASLSLKMRFDGKVHMAFLEELRDRLQQGES